MAGARKPLISGNWKLNLNHFEAIQTVQKLAYNLTKDDYAAVDVSVHPPFTDLRSVQTVLEADRIPIALGAQNCYFEESGAFTGEIGPSMLAKLDVTLVIVGHSERRQIFGETDEMVHKKVHAAFAAGMTPILCCGETLEEREEGGTDAKLELQVRSGLRGLTPEQVSSMVIAYEPLWAIGTGKVASPDDAEAHTRFIRGLVDEQFGADAAASIRIQYGGSVKGGNIAGLMAMPDVDGALVGGASLDPDEFAHIVQYRLHT